MIVVHGWYGVNETHDLFTEDGECVTYGTADKILAWLMERGFKPVDDCITWSNEE